MLSRRRWISSEILRDVAITILTVPVPARRYLRSPYEEHTDWQGALHRQLSRMASVSAEGLMHSTIDSSSWQRR